MSEEVASARLFGLLDHLIDRWCERRALRPLGLILPAYPPAPIHTDQWATLYAAIRGLKGLGADQLLADESAAVAELHAAVYQLMKQTAAGRSILDEAV